MKMTNLKSALALGAAVLTLSVGGAFAATMVDSNVDIMSGPGANFHTVGKLKMDDNVAVVRTSGDWCRISAPTTGWIPCNNISGLTTGQRTNSVAPAVNKGYDWATDPNFGPAAQGGLHTVYNGSFS
jgi:uncharacterized protein YraI